MIKMTNQMIYEAANKLSALNIAGYLPVKISFFLQKNISLIINLAKEIDNVKLSLGQKYGEPNQFGEGYYIKSENMELVNKELTDLFSLEQDVNIHIFKLAEFDEIELTYEQLAAIAFMIEE